MSTFLLAFSFEQSAARSPALPFIFTIARLFSHGHEKTLRQVFSMITDFSPLPSFLQYLAASRQAESSNI